jgi:hypothetical protein
MNDDLKALFPWLGSQNIQYDPASNIRTQTPLKSEGEDIKFSKDKEITLGYGFQVNNQPYVYVPKSFLEKGFVDNGHQFYMPSALAPNFEQGLQQTGKFYSPKEITNLTGNNSFEKAYNESEFKGEDGVLIPKQLIADNSARLDYGNEIFNVYKIGDASNDYGISTGAIQGVGVKDGQKVYVQSAWGRQNPTAWITYNQESKTPQSYVQYYEPGKKWYETGLGKVGIGLIGLGTAGLALGGLGAAGGAAAGGGGITLGAGGTTGLTIGSGATTAAAVGGAGTAGAVAPAGFVFAPTVGAGVGAGTAAAGLLDGATFGGQGLKVPAINSSQVALIPEGTALAGQGLQVPTLPGLSAMGGGTGLAVGVPGGTVTQLGFVPTGATPVLGDPASFINNPDVLGNTVFSTDYLAAPGAAASGMSAMDALRLANQARGLLGAGQNPIVPQQQGLPQDGGAAGRGVDYSGLLSLLQLQARTPGVSSLTAPAQLRQIYQPTLLPNVLSLLG